MKNTKNIYNIHNSQGAWLMTVVAKDEINAVRQAKKVWDGKVYATKFN